MIMYIKLIYPCSRPVNCVVSKVVTIRLEISPFLLAHWNINILWNQFPTETDKCNIDIFKRSNCGFLKSYLVITT